MINRKGVVIDRINGKTSEKTLAHELTPLAPVVIADAVTVGPAGLAVAFGAGVIGFASPCVLPLIPGYLAFVSGVPGGSLPEQRRRVVRAAVGFVAGFTAVFTLAGAGSGIVGAQFLDHRDTLEKIGGAIIIGMGIFMLLPTARAAAAGVAGSRPPDRRTRSAPRWPAPPSPSPGRRASAPRWGRS